MLAQGIEAVFFVKPHLTGRCRVAVATNFAVVPWLRKLRPSGQQLVALAEALYQGAVGPVKKQPEEVCFADTYVQEALWWEADENL